MKNGGILNNLLRPFINVINATQPACHGPVIPPNLFSTTHTVSHPLVNDKPAVTQETVTQTAPTTNNQTHDFANDAPSDNEEIAQTHVETEARKEIQTATQAKAQTDPSTLIESASAFETNSVMFDPNLSEKATAKNKEKSREINPSVLLNEVLRPIETATVTEPKKKRTRRKNEVSGTDVLQNWDKPLLMRLRPHRAAGYDKNDHAIDHPRFKLVKTNGRSRFEKAEGTTETTALSKRRKPRQQ